MKQIFFSLIPCLDSLLLYWQLCAQPIFFFVFRAQCLVFAEQLLKALGYRPNTVLIGHYATPDKQFVLWQLLELIAVVIVSDYVYQVLSLASDPTVLNPPVVSPVEVDSSFYEGEFVPETEEMPPKPRLSFSTLFKDPGFMFCLCVVVVGGVALANIR